MELTRRTTDRNWRIRPDGESKVAGTMKYLTDLSFPDMLYGTILRSRHPHAEVIDVSVEAALRLPGVCAALTSRDVPGLNRFGLVIQDQPVFCEDRVRYVGDAIAVVAAETKEIAERALDLIEVTYRPLPVMDSPQKAMSSEAVALHGDGNVLHRNVYCRGDVSESFRHCLHVVENTYETPRQMHTYMETEGGVFVPGADGSLTVYAPTQHGYGDRRQLSRILALAEEKIRVVSSPIGGSFGGKDELNVQPYGALLALATGRPVKVHQTRRESVQSGIKRHPMRITMKTGVDAQGKLVAHQVRIVADTGAYASLGPAVVDFAVEHAVGPYQIEHVDVEGIAVYTSNGVAGEFRGFGGNQVTFALEGQMARLAEKLALDPLEFRKRNVRSAHDAGPLGQTIVPTNGARDVLTEMERMPLWQQRVHAAQRRPSKTALQEVECKFLRRGVGIAMTMHGGGLGLRRPDDTGGRLMLTADGKVEAAFGFEEFGQGIVSAIPLIVSEALGCACEDVRVTIGDTAVVPKSGSSTASRATGMVWQSVQRMKREWTEQVLSCASAVTGCPQQSLTIGPSGVWSIPTPDDAGELLVDFATLAKGLARLPAVESESEFPTTPDVHASDGAHYLYSFAGVIAEVEVDLTTGHVRVTALHQCISAGPVVNPMGYLGQIEGGGVMGLGFTLMEDCLMEAGRYVTNNLDTYLVPTIRDTPPWMSVHAIEAHDALDAYGPRGVGEIGTVAVAPAIAAAIHDAVGHWVSHLPVSPEEILHAASDCGKDVLTCL